MLVALVKGLQSRDCIDITSAEHTNRTTFNIELSKIGLKRVRYSWYT